MYQIIKNIIFIFILFPTFAFALPAFPGAEGFGSDTVGGRSGTVYIVSNLNDTGAGSFREAVTASGARYVVFSVSGYIDLQTQLQITNPYITIAGETSPGGICIVGEQTTIRTHDIIIRHMRFRLGQADADDDPNDPNEHDSFDIWGNGSHDNEDDDAYNIIIDHCSFSWGADETVTMTYGPHHITFSWNMVYEGLKTDASHSKGLLIDQKLVDAGQPGAIYISGHHNYIGSSVDRNPLFAGNNEYYGWVDWRNNISYNYYGDNSLIVQSDGAAGNFISNYTKAGPESNAAESSWPMAKVDRLDLTDYAYNEMYVYGNIGNQFDTSNYADWCVEDYYFGSLVDAEYYQKLTPHDTTGGVVTTTAMTVTYAEEGIAPYVGAIKPTRDSADIAEISDFLNGTGSIPTWKAYPEDYPTLSTPDAPTDSDSDGMSDVWEMATFGDLDQTATTDFDSDGYDDLEEYLHYLAGYEAEEPEATTATINCSGPFNSN